MRPQRDGASLGSCSGCGTSDGGGTSLSVFWLGSGLICSPNTTSRLIDVPGGSQVMSVAIDGRSGSGSSTLKSVGPTTRVS